MGPEVLLEGGRLKVREWLGGPPGGPAVVQTSCWSAVKGREVLHVG